MRCTAGVHSGTPAVLHIINDLHKYLNECSIGLYADDTALYTSAKSQIEIMLNFQLELSLVQEWLNANKLTLNANKTKYVIFGSRRTLASKPNLNLRVGNRKIERGNINEISVCNFGRVSNL